MPISDSSYHFGNAAVEGDNKPDFLRSFCQWLKQWDENKIANCEAFTLSKQNREALLRTSLCHAALIEDLVADGFDIVLRSRFQTALIERRYGHDFLQYECRNFSCIVERYYIIRKDIENKKSCQKRHKNRRDCQVNCAA